MPPVFLSALREAWSRKSTAMSDTVPAVIARPVCPPGAATARIDGSTRTIAGGSTLMSQLDSATLSNYALATSNDGLGGTSVSYVPNAPSHPAIPVVAGTLDLGHHRPGDAVTAALIIGNADRQGGDSLVASLIAPLPFGGVGTQMIGPGNSGTFAVRLTTSADGVALGSTLVTLASSIGTAAPTTLPSAIVALTGTAYALAVPALPASLSLGATRIGLPARSGSIAISDCGAADPYRESLVLATGTAPAGLAVVSGGNGMIAAGTTTAIKLPASSAIAGHIAGTIPLALTSTGAGNSLLAGREPSRGILPRRRRPFELRQRHRPDRALSRFHLVPMGSRRLRAAGGHRGGAERSNMMAVGAGATPADPAQSRTRRRVRAPYVARVAIRTRCAAYSQPA